MVRNWLVILLAFAFAASVAQNYFLNQTNTQLTIINETLAKEILKPVIPKKVYIVGCQSPSAAILVFSNGNSHLTQGTAQLMKLERRLPKDLPTDFFQAPDCRTSGT